MITDAEIKHSFYRASLFQVLPVTRAIYIVRLSENLVELHVYNDRLLSEEEKDACYSITAEMSGDFVGLKVQIQLLVDSQPFHEGKGPEGGLPVYGRYEYLVGRT